MARYVFITGGVVSSLGKGLASAALGALLQARGYKVRLRKLDPYLNVDPGTMSPYQHGEVFVTDDGAETDLDLGHYERFTGVSAARSDNNNNNNKRPERERQKQKTKIINYYSDGRLRTGWWWGPFPPADRKKRSHPPAEDPGPGHRRTKGENVRFSTAGGNFRRRRQG